MSAAPLRQRNLVGPSCSRCPSVASRDGLCVSCDERVKALILARDLGKLALVQARISHNARIEVKGQYLKGPTFTVLQADAERAVIVLNAAKVGEYDLLVRSRL